MKLREKIVKIMKAGALEKDAKMQAVGKYNYHSIDGVVDHLRRQFVKHGVVFNYTTLEFDMDLRENGTFVVTKKLEIRLTDVESGETISGVEVGIGIDKQDKATGKATSYALKTWLTATFMLKGNPDENDAIVEVVAEQAPASETAELYARVLKLGIDEAKFLKAAEAKSFQTIAANRVLSLSKMLDMKEAAK